MTIVAPQTVIENPLLERIAEHERSLLGQLEDARNEAQAMIDHARAQAQVVRQDDERRLADEVLRFRREAETARAAEYAATVQAARAGTDADRRYVSEHAAEVANEVLEMVLPGVEQ
jgi:vacuolar-type H+-ATPase subunit H